MRPGRGYIKVFTCKALYLILFDMILHKICTHKILRVPTKSSLAKKCVQSTAEQTAADTQRRICRTKRFHLWKLMGLLSSFRVFMKSGQRISFFGSEIHVVDGFRKLIDGHKSLI